MGAAAANLAERAPDAELFARLLELEAGLANVPNAALPDALAACGRLTAAMRALTLALVSETAVAGQDPDSAERRGLDEGGICEVQFALRMSAGRAGREVGYAHTLRERVPAVGAALRAGDIDDAHARVFADDTSVLPEPTARLVVEALLPHCMDLTLPALGQAILEQAMSLDPEYMMALLNQARGMENVTARRNRDGTVTIFGVNLDAVDAAAAIGRVDLLAKTAKGDGDPRGVCHLRVILFIGLLSGRFAMMSDAAILDHLKATRPADEPDTGSDDGGTAGPGPDSKDPTSGPDAGGTAGPEPDSSDPTSGPDGGGPASHGPDTNSPDPAGPASHGPDTNGPDGGGPSAGLAGSRAGNAGADHGAAEGGSQGDAAAGPATGRRSDPAPESILADHVTPENSPRHEPDQGHKPAASAGHGPVSNEAAGARPADPAPGDPPPAEPPPVEPPPADPGPGDPAPTVFCPGIGVHLKVKLSTLLGRDIHPGELAGHGPLSAAAVRELVRTYSAGRWLWVLCGTDGHLADIGTTRARPTGYGRRRGAVAAVVEIRLDPALLAELLAGGSHPDWTPVLADIATQHAAGYDPPDPARRFPDAALRRRVIAATPACIGPWCHAGASRCDLDHLVPHPDGPTDEHNLKPECRREHRRKTHGTLAVEAVGAHRHRWSTRLGQQTIVTSPPLIRPLPDPVADPAPAPNDFSRCQPAATRPDPDAWRRDSPWLPVKPRPKPIRARDWSKPRPEPKPRRRYDDHDDRPRRPRVSLIRSRPKRPQTDTPPF